MTIDTVSNAQGTLHHVLSLSRERLTLGAQIKMQNEQLMDYVENRGEVLLYDREDTPRIYSVVWKPRTRLDRARLAYDLGVKTRELTLGRIADLVKEGRLDSERLTQYEIHDVVRKLKKRKAKRKDIQKFASEK